MSILMHFFSLGKYFAYPNKIDLFNRYGVLKLS